MAGTRLHRRSSALLVVDLQDKLLAVIPSRERLLDRASLLLRAAALLDVPVTVTEQYPAGLGRTAESLRPFVTERTVLHEKTAFSALAEPAVAAHLESLRRRHVVVTGAEAHVCVYQTVLDLMAAGFRVHVAADAVASRHEANVGLALSSLAAQGAVVVPTETVVFELLERAGTPEFKALLPHIR